MRIFVRIKGKMTVWGMIINSFFSEIMKLRKWHLSNFGFIFRNFYKKIIFCCFFCVGKRTILHVSLIFNKTLGQSIDNNNYSDYALNDMLFWFFFFIFCSFHATLITSNAHINFGFFFIWREKFRTFFRRDYTCAVCSISWINFFINFVIVRECLNCCECEVWNWW